VRRGRHIPALAALLVALPSGAVRSAEVEIPLTPSLESFEEPVQQQLGGVRQRLDELLADRAAPDELVGDALGGMGQLYFLYDLFEAAAECFSEATRLLPGDFRWPYYLGVIAADGMDLAAAVGHFERAAELAPEDLPTLLRLGRILLDAGDLEGAERRFEAALSLDPELAAAHHGLGRVAFARRDYETAATRFENVLEIQPSAVSVNNLLGMSYRQLGEEELARAHLAITAKGGVLFADPLVDQLTDLVASARVHAERGIELMQQGETQAGLEELRKTVQQSPDDFLAHHNLAIGLTRAKEDDAAIAAYRRSIELNPDYPGSRFNLGLLLAWQENHEAAIEQLGKAHELDPEDARVTLEWAKGLALIGRLEESRTALERLIETAPPDERWRAMLRLGDVVLRQGDREGAAAAWRRLIDSDAPEQGQAQAWQSLGRLANERGALAEAAQLYRKAAEAAPGSSIFRAGAARAEARVGNFEEAARQYSSALEIDPDDAESHFGRGLALMMDNRLIEAREALLASVEQLGVVAAVIDLTAQLLAGSPDPALRDGVLAESLLRRVPPEEASSSLVEAMAMALASQGRFEEAHDLQEELARRIAAFDAEKAQRAADRAQLYGDGEVCVAPWLDKGRCRAPR
jgi:tetratricopeptide (TPR) repeat protein